MHGKTIEILKKAQKEGRAVGAFNTSGLEIAQGIARAACELEKSCIIQITPSTMEYLGAKTAGAITRAAIENDSNSCQIGFHLDHGKTFDDVIKAINAGADSVMIDASRLKFKENLEITKRVVDYAHAKNVAVQAELGNVPYLGREDQAIDWEKVMTDPEEALEMVQATNVDALAVGIGNAHGFFREREVPDWERLARIRKLLPDIPLIMHGASDWGKEKVERAIAGGICCFNIDTDIRLAFMKAICDVLGGKCEITDPRKMFIPARQAVIEKVKEKIAMFDLINF